MKPGCHPLDNSHKCVHVPTHLARSRGKDKWRVRHGGERAGARSSTVRRWHESAAVPNCAPVAQLRHFNLLPKLRGHHAVLMNSPYCLHPHPQHGLLTHHGHTHLHPHLLSGRLLHLVLECWVGACVWSVSAVDVEELSGKPGLAAVKPVGARRAHGALQEHLHRRRGGGLDRRAGHRGRARVVDTPAHRRARDAQTLRARQRRRARNAVRGGVEHVACIRVFTSVHPRP